MQDRATGIAEYKFDTFVFKTLDKDMSATEFQFNALEKTTALEEKPLNTWPAQVFYPALQAV
jgi:hypothetical protein